MYYIIFEKDTDNFYGWTESEELKDVFIEENKETHYAVKSKVLLDDSMRKFEDKIYDYELDAYFQGQLEKPLVLSNMDFGLLESRMFKLVFETSNAANHLSHLARGYRMHNKNKAMFIELFKTMAIDCNEVANDDEPVYGDLIKIIDFYNVVSGKAKKLKKKKK